MTKPKSRTALWIVLGVLLTAAFAAGVYIQETQPPRYAWQRRCRNTCGDSLGWDRMAWIDGQGCVTMQANVGEKRTKNQAEWDAAVADRIEALGCR